LGGLFPHLLKATKSRANWQLENPRRIAGAFVIGNYTLGKGDWVIWRKSGFWLIRGLAVFSSEIDGQQKESDDYPHQNQRSDDVWITMRLIGDEIGHADDGKKD
jgi:hypothetical protein